MNINDKISALIVTWLKRERGIEARSARIDSDYEHYRLDGCDTCDYDAYEEWTSYIYYVDMDGNRRVEYVKQNPMTFLFEELIPLDMEGVE